MALPWPAGVIVLGDVDVPDIPIFFHHSLDFFDPKYYSSRFQVSDVKDNLCVSCRNVC